jgi:hypothetical protein
MSTPEVDPYFANTQGSKIFTGIGRLKKIHPLNNY